MNPDLLSTLAVPLPPGRLITSDEGAGGARTLWLSDGVAPEGLWGRLLAEHHRSGVWPLLLDALDPNDDEFRPWGSGELFPERMSSPADHDPDDVLAAWWATLTAGDAYDDALDVKRRLATTAPFGQAWPGPAPGREGVVDPVGTACALARSFLADHPRTRLGLVAARSGAEAPAVAGWQGPCNHENDTGRVSAVLRDWEVRFGARVVAAGFDTLHLSVAAPPTGERDALLVAAEHFALCPDNIWQGDRPYTLAAYAERIVGAHRWDFWWD
ncbi:DUF4253 domain-containing protein [Streptomyces sp. NPDC048606]|uniref:DUF4253 domain-containing protein n=1 Tax=Streptomyces sp. NPDC048606 TaxID=3154726 RepID=UPI003444D7F4